MNVARGPERPFRPFRSGPCARPCAAEGDDEDQPVLVGEMDADALALVVHERALPGSAVARSVRCTRPAGRPGCRHAPGGEQPSEWGGEAVEGAVRAAEEVREDAIPH